MLDSNVATDTLNQLSELNITFSVDGYGADYSSLATIDTSPIGQLKIDHNFFNQLHWSDEQDSQKPGSHYSLVYAILLWVKALQLEMIAEGVDTEE
ncbi:MAG: EAL domain-containing protein [Candidatus Thiodiazotropha lotti]|nr:EAL domain-containing protein [Candidatus Thiodiazotropha lotti]ODB98971.1 hypothetical protein A3197_16355 [Candidatus Thiodiazotropha endoloripes]